MKSEFVLRHGGASVLIAEDQEHVDKVLPLLGQLPDLRKIVVIDDSNMFGYADPALMSLNDLVGLGTSVAGGSGRILCAFAGRFGRMIPRPSSIPRARAPIRKVPSTRTGR